jgi:site-specific recombinase XerD
VPNRFLSLLDFLAARPRGPTPNTENQKQPGFEGFCDVTDNELLESFYLECLARGLRTKSIDNYAERLTYLLTYLRTTDRTLAICTREDVKGYIVAMLRRTPPLSPSTINGRLGAWRAFFNYLTDPDRHPDGPLLPVNPMSSIRQLAVDVVRPQYLTPAQVNQILRTWDVRRPQNRGGGFIASRNRALTILMYDTMIRPGEATRLTLDDITFRAKTGGTLCIRRAKDRQERHLPIHPAVARSLHEYFHRWRRPLPGPFFFCQENGDPLTVDRLSRLYYSVSRKVGYRVTAYMFRHSGATGYCRRGGSIEILQDIMGHSDIRITRRYVHPEEDRAAEQHSIRSAVNLLNER